MKIENKPFLTMEATLTLNHSELEMLNRLCSYGAAVAEPIIGKDAIPDRKEPWARFLANVRAVTDTCLDRFNQANDVFQGKKDAVAPKQRRLDAAEAE